MVIPCAAAAAQSAAAAGSAGATALGLGMGKTDLDLTRNLFKLQMRQAKRLWTADYAESSLRHGESCMQSAQQHAESQAMAMATYYQAEKLASQSIKLARDQDSRGYEMTWRAEVRESLRDELANQNNRFNIIMLCDTVCLSCVFSLVADGSPPIETSVVMLNIYVFSLGLSVSLFTISLWCSVIVVRRLHEHTASILERKLFAQSEDLQKVWQQQLQRNLPTGPYEMYLVNQAYSKWISERIDPIGKTSIHMLSIGVVAMFFTAGLLVHNQYLVDYETPISVPILFWSTVFITSTTVLWMKFYEDRLEKQKLGVYDNSWQDTTSWETGPFAKILKAAQELFSDNATTLGDVKRMESLASSEQMERNMCIQTKSLNQRVNELRKESSQRLRTRKDVLQLLTTAAEELDALPEDLTSRLNQMIHDIDEADRRTANLVTMEKEVLEDDDDDDDSGHNRLVHEASRSDWSRLRRVQQVSLRRRLRQPMSPHPIDAQRLPISLGSLRKKLGEVPITTMLRIKNVADEPLRLKSGVQLKEGKYIKSLQAMDPQSNTVCYHLYPGTEIPPRTEVVIVARSNGSGWIPTSGIVGQLVYTNKDESWIFRIKFCNELIRNTRKCQVQAIRATARTTSTGTTDAPSSWKTVDDDHDKAFAVASTTTPAGGGEADGESSSYWQISKDELDRKSNNEVSVSIDVLRGEEAAKALYSDRQSQVSLKSGFLLKNKKFGLGLQWSQRWFVLTPTDIIYENVETKKSSKIPLKEIIQVRRGKDLVKKNVLEIHTTHHLHDPNAPVGGAGGGGGALQMREYKFAAPSPADRDDWIFKISAATGMDVAELMQNDDDDNNNNNGTNPPTTTPTEESVGSGGAGGGGEEEDVPNPSIECLRTDMGTAVLPPNLIG